jgi:hypothetical protein
MGGIVPVDLPVIVNDLLILALGASRQVAIEGEPVGIKGQPGMRTDIPGCVAFRRESIQVSPVLQPHVAARFRLDEYAVNRDCGKKPASTKRVPEPRSYERPRLRFDCRPVYNLLTMPR